MRRLIPLLVLIAAAGCASAHRRAVSSHTFERFTGRSDGLVSREEWYDLERGGGVECLSDQQFNDLTVIHKNQSGSVVIGSGLTNKTSTNADKVVTAAGQAVGTAAGTVVADVIKASK